MSLPTTAHLSLLQVIQSVEPTLEPGDISPLDGGGLVQGLLQTCRDQGITAQVWCKLPDAWDWWNAIADYSQSGLATQIYLCQTEKKSLKREIVGGITLGLETSQNLQQEYWLIVLSSQLSAVLVTQGTQKSDIPQHFTRETLRFRLSFSPHTIATVLTSLKQHLTVTDQTPVTLMLEEQSAIAVGHSWGTLLEDSSHLSAELLTQLWQQQWQHLSVASLPQILVPVPLREGEIAPDNARFLNQVTQELSLPLTNMKTALRLLESLQHKREQRQRYLELLRRECDRQTSIIAGVQEILQLNQPLDPQDQTVQLEECVPGVVSIYQPLATEKGISLGYTIPAGLPLVHCPTTWLKQILQHLLHNSLKFTPAQGKVTVRATLQGEKIELTVTDTGIGIEASELPLLFDYFYRGRQQLSQETGAGLGLAIVQQLVQRCGGSVTVQSQVGRGSTFRLLLPLN